MIDIAADSSHSMRFPLWLKSLAEAYAEGSLEKMYYKKLIKGLAKQFLYRVLVFPTDEFAGYRTNNFMDGRNGVYRWGYVTQGPANGYGPYELSGSFLLGWWFFLDNYEIRNIYKEMSQYFPLKPEIIPVYIGPGTSRERNKYITYAYFNGFIELIVRLASKYYFN